MINIHFVHNTCKKVNQGLNQELMSDGNIYIFLIKRLHVSFRINRLEHIDEIIIYVYIYIYIYQSYQSLIE